MRKLLKRALPMLIALAVIGYNPLVAPACGPFFPEIIFTNTLHPDLPIGPYTKGELGVIQPSYANIFLYVAYRNLSGIPIRAAGQAALWAGKPALTGKAAPAPSQSGSHDWVQRWGLAAGTAVNVGDGIKTPEGIFRRIVRSQNKFEFYSQFLNCPQDAFREALATLENRTQQFGKSSPVVESWLHAQEQVFGNCSTGEVIPAVLPSSASPAAQADRAYQIAAAYFYAGEYDKAADAFRAIAQDQSSPWSDVAPYLVARALVRKATVGNMNDIDLTPLAHAEAQLDSMLANPRYAKYHHAAERLRGFIEFRLHPRERLVKLANNLMKPHDADFRQDVTDYTFLLGRLQSGSFPSGAPRPNPYNSYSYLAQERAQSDLIDWMMTLKLKNAEGFSHSLKKWESTNSLAWLVAALTAASPGDPHVPELLHAAAGVSPFSPAYDSVTFQSLRLMLLQGKDDAVRERLAHLPAGHMPPSTVNLFLAMRFELAQNLDELLKTAPRAPATVTDGSEPEEMPGTYTYPPYNNVNFSENRFDGDALVVLNRVLPVNMLAAAARSPMLAESLRREIALAAWTRAALLGDVAVTRALAPQVEGFVPELRAGVRAYNSEATAAARRFAAALTFLRFPGLRPFITTLARVTPLGEIDNYRDNWWGTVGPVCAPVTQYVSGRPVPFTPPPVQVLLLQWPEISPAIQAIYPGGKVKPPAFLTASERATGADEWQRLAVSGPAPDYLSREVIAWAKTHPRDPRVPEALALAVKSTRFGCVDKETGGLSKEAFDLLHGRYPGTSWAAQTKYWYKP